ncbi:MAG: response regulator [Burkholderiales bacterium]|jgi:FixJ family two-component response regulator|nr:response regulator [Burkholderiales bacterium]
MNPPVAAITVHIVDDDDSMRSALTRLFFAAGYAPRAYASAGEFLIALEAVPSGCLILDLHMPGPDGLALFEALHRRGINLPTIFLTGRGDIPSSVRALKSGASDFLTKPVSSDTLLEAVRAALEADAPKRAERAQREQLAKVQEQLTARERAVLQRVLQGALTKQIAWELGVSERTIKACRAAVMRKMGARSLPDLVRLSSGLPETPTLPPVV